MVIGLNFLPVFQQAIGEGFGLEEAGDEIGSGAVVAGLFEKSAHVAG